MKRLTLIILFAGMLMVPWGGVQAEENGKAFDAHATSFSYFFKDADMDFHFGNLVLGSAVNGGVEIGEAFYAASQIKDGDAVSWQTAWYELAKRVEGRGREALKLGHTVSAREQLLRAAYYYRISLLAMLPDNPELEKRGLKCRSLMKQAGGLSSLLWSTSRFPLRILSFRDFSQGRFLVNPAKTLLMIGGGETYIEDLFFYIARQAHERGYNS